MLRHWWRWALRIWYWEIMRQQRENRWLVFTSMYIVGIVEKDRRRSYIKEQMAFWKGETV